MPNVTFDEEPSYVPSHPQPANKNGSIIGLMYRLGLAKTQKDATVILSSVIVACIVLSATLIVFVQPHGNPAQAAQLQQDQARMAAYIAAHPSH